MVFTRFNKHVMRIISTSDHFRLCSRSGTLVKERLKTPDKCHHNSSLTQHFTVCWSISHTLSENQHVGQCLGVLLVALQLMKVHTTDTTVKGRVFLAQCSLLHAARVMLYVHGCWIEHFSEHFLITPIGCWKLMAGRGLPYRMSVSSGTLYGLTKILSQSVNWQNATRRWTTL
jgi:hypothetical protein